MKQYENEEIQKKRENARNYYYKNREKQLELRKKYREKNKEKISLRESLRRISDPNRFEKNRIYYRNWSKENKEKINEKNKKWREQNKEKRNANSKLRYAINTGKIMRPNNCSECNKKCKPDGHHLDYNKPLDVLWICSACHSRKSPRTIIT